MQPRRHWTPRDTFANTLAYLLATAAFGLSAFALAFLVGLMAQ